MPTYDGFVPVAETPCRLTPRAHTRLTRETDSVWFGLLRANSMVNSWQRATVEIHERWSGSVSSVNPIRLVPPSHAQLFPAKPRIKFSELPTLLDGLLLPADPVRIEYSVEKDLVRNRAIYDMDVEVVRFSSFSASLIATPH